MDKKIAFLRYLCTAYCIQYYTTIDTRRVRSPRFENQPINHFSRTLSSITQRKISVHPKALIMLSSRALKAFSRVGVPSKGSRAMASLAGYEDFGKNVFSGAVADEYLKKHGSTKEILNDPNWVNNHADTVANALFDW